MLDDRGFTLAEVLVAMVVSAVAMGAAYVVLDAGLDLHADGTRATVSATGLADTMVRLRADVARASSVDYADADSLHLVLPDGRALAWAARPIADGLALYRSIDEGSGLDESPKRPLIELSDTASHPATVDFTLESRGVVRAHLCTGGRNLSIEAAPWGGP